MHRTAPVTTLLYNHLFPKPTSSDPSSFSNHLARNLIPEIRIETARFYGSLDTIEARYPGLNYTHPPHIRRLTCFPHHRRLFKAIAELRITESEVLDLARWEGTLWARERFEKDEGYPVLDTTGDDIGEWKDPRKTVKINAVKAATTTSSSTVAATQDLPAPQSATACELEAQDHDSEPRRSELEEAPEPAPVTTLAETTRGPDAVVGEHGARTTAEASLPSPPQSASGSNDSPEQARARATRNAAPSLRQILDRYWSAPINSMVSPIIRNDLEELFHVLAAAQDREVHLFRNVIISRLRLANRELPSARQLISEINTYLDRRLQYNAAAAADVAVVAASGIFTRQAISQPAARG